MKSGAGTERVNRLGFPGNEVDPMPADGGDDSVRLACPAAGAWEAGQPSGCCCRVRCHLIKISRPQTISHMPVRAFPSHPATAAPCRRPRTVVPVLANHTRRSSPETRHLSCASLGVATAASYPQSSETEAPGRNIRRSPGQRGFARA